MALQLGVLAEDILINDNPWEDADLTEFDWIGWDGEAEEEEENELYTLRPDGTPRTQAERDWVNLNF